MGGEGAILLSDRSRWKLETQLKHNDVDKHFHDATSPTNERQRHSRDRRVSTALFFVDSGPIDDIAVT